MKPIDYFKLQAKNLHKDYKTKTPEFDDVFGHTHYKYNPKFFDIDGIFIAYDQDEEDFSLMKAQHLISNMAGFNKWSELVNATEIELELAKLLFENQVNLAEWDVYLSISATMENTVAITTPEMKIEVLKHVFLNNKDAHRDMFDDFMIAKTTANQNN